MDLSVIIVNYNVKYFLEQCLCSVVKASEQLSTEIFVVDNDSKDGSVEYLQPLFPRVKFIANKANDGFAKANNKALQLCKGNYILFLNPDTIVPEDCFTNCLKFFKKHNDCGALGVQMIDGSGNFLPESKRSFPKLSSSFFKLSGLSLLFPKSGLFNRYALGNLDKNKNYEVDVLAGAYMMLSKPVIEATKGFDETYFMYGEDIDLSYEVQKNGFKNYYFGEQKIIHFKGESTKRGSLNYVRLFYKAMSVFVNKHYSNSKATLFNLIINIAIWFRAIISLLQGIIAQSGMLLIDAGVVASTLYFAKYLWEQKINNGVIFNSPLANYYIPIFTFVFIIGAVLSGIYDNLYKPLKALVSSFSAVVVMLAVYSLMPEDYRFSRGVILSGGILSGLMVTLIRWLFIQLGFIKDTESEKNRKLVIVGSLIEHNNALQLLQKVDVENRFLGRISIKENEENTIGHINNLEKLQKQIGFSEIIFCEGSLTFNYIISAIYNLRNKKISFKFYGKKTNCIVGSDSKTETGETITNAGLYRINSPYQKRMKRLIDTWISLFILITAPMQFLFIQNTAKAFANAWQIMLRRKTWVGYSSQTNQLPKLNLSVLTPSGYPNTGRFDVIASVLKKTDTLYAKEYDWLMDVKIIFSNYKNLGS